MSQLTAPKGTFDTLPPDSERFLAVRDALTAPLRRAGYGYVETPVFEHTAVFSRGVGESPTTCRRRCTRSTTAAADR